MSDRAVSPVLGIVLLLVVTAALAGAIGTLALGTPVPSESSSALLDLQVDAGEDRLTLVHRGGDVLDVAALTIRVTIDGTPLDAQPPVPFFSAAGFYPGPTGPFNSAADQQWQAGERASVRLAGTNDPLISPNSTVVVTLSTDGSMVAEVEATA